MKEFLTSRKKTPDLFENLLMLNLKIEIALKGFQPNHLRHKSRQHFVS